MSSPVTACPTCGARVAWSADNPFRPFCSERCKLVDLGGWLEERYRIPGDPLPDSHQDPADHSGGTPRLQ